MSDNNPGLPGAPKPPEGSKVQPKKETVRINLPPKPSAAPTIKLPTLPPGGPSAGTPATAQAHAPATSAPPAPVRTGAAPVATAAPTQRPMQRAAAPVAPAISGLDKGLAIGAVVAALFAAGTTAYCLTLFT